MSWMLGAMKDANGRGSVGKKRFNPLCTKTQRILGAGLDNSTAMGEGRASFHLCELVGRIL